MIRAKPPYYNFKALGFKSNYLNGYEYYVIDGLDYAYLKTRISYLLFQKELFFGKYMPIEAYKTMAFRIYLASHFNTGYVNNPHYSYTNSLSNRWLTGAGFGLDIVLYNSYLFQVNYTVNHLWENGIFLHYKFAF
jgi:hypothetical protein